MMAAEEVFEGSPEQQNISIASSCLSMKLRVYIEGYLRLMKEGTPLRAMMIIEI